MNKLKLVFIFLLIGFLSLSDLTGQALDIKAEDTLVYTADKKLIEVGGYARCFSDTSNSLSFEQIQNLPDSVFKKTRTGVLSFGNTTASVWIKLRVKNTVKEALFLNFWNFGLQILDVFTYSENGELLVRQSGNTRPFESRDLQRGNITINIGQSPKVVYICIQSRYPISTLVSLSPLLPLANVHHERDTFNGICMGILIAMALYNLFLFFSVRERLYLYYFAYILIALWTVSEINSTWRYFIGWPYGRGPTQELLCITGILFSMRFLNTRKTIPYGHILLIIFLVLSCFSILFVYILDWQPFGNVFSQSMAIGCSLTLPSLGFLAYRRGNKSALFYTIAWFILIVFAIVNILSGIGILPINFWTKNTLAVGTCLETILLAFALAYRIKIYRDASESSQQLAFQRLEENEHLVREQNKVLEEKVTERTEVLQNTLHQLQNTESQLVQSEKMAALGELTAGIAHEINNPVNFISSSLVPLKRNLDVIDHLMQQYDSLTKDNFEAKIKEIKTYKTEIDYDYTKEEINLLTNSIKDGAHRTAEIVKGLRNFSRLDEADKKKASVNEGLESTLFLMQSALKKKNIQLIKDLGELPEIECYAGQLNQVFMNILTNAVQALPDKGTISVKSFVEKTSNTIKISIADNGKGMSEEVKSKIFQPFFTTKDVGEGTGLGLSISYGIIQKHNGQIDVYTKLGEGTNFIITLPIN